jgi:hypothetical protein
MIKAIRGNLFSGNGNYYSSLDNQETKRLKKYYMATATSSNKKVNFRILYQQFKKKVVAHFSITILRAILIEFIFGAIVALFRQENLTSSSNYTPLLIPKPFRSFFSDYHLNQGKFILIMLGVIALFAFSFYWDYLWEEELRIKGGHWIKNRLLAKFRRLPFEEQKSREKEVSKLVENDA